MNRIEWVSTSNLKVYYFGILLHKKQSTTEYLYGGDLYSPAADYTLLAIF